MSCSSIPLNGAIYAELIWLQDWIESTAKTWQILRVSVARRGMSCARSEGSGSFRASEVGVVRVFEIIESVRTNVMELTRE